MKPCTVLLLALAAAALVSPLAAADDICADESIKADQIASEAAKVSAVAPSMGWKETWEQGQSRPCDDLNTMLLEGTYNDDATTEKYAHATLGLAVPAIVLACITLFLLPWVICARCCCKGCCCAPKKTLDEWSVCERWTPFVIFMLCSVICVFCSIVNITNFGDMAQATTDGVCVMDKAVQTDLPKFFDSVQMPVADLLKATTTMVDDFKVETEAITTDPNLGKRCENLAGELGTFSDLLADVKGPPNRNGNMMTTAATSMSDFQAELEGNVQGTADEMMAVIVSINAGLIGMQETLIATAAPMDEGVKSAKTMIKETMEPGINDAKKAVGDNLGQLSTGSAVAHAPVFFGFAACVLAFITYMTSCCKADDMIGNCALHITWITTMIYMVLLLLLAAAMAPAAVVLADVCYVAYEAPNDWQLYFNIGNDLCTDTRGGPNDFAAGTKTDDVCICEGNVNAAPTKGEDAMCVTGQACFPGKPKEGDDPAVPDAKCGDPLPEDEWGMTADPAVIIDGCMNGVSLGEIFNIAKNFEGTEDVFSDMPDEEKVTKAEAGLDKMQLDFDTAKDEIATAMTVENICKNDENQEECKTYAEGVIQSVNTQAQKISDDLKPFISAYKDSFSALGGMQETFKTDFLTALDGVGTAGDCSFIAGMYEGFRDSICDGAQPAIGSISINLFVIAVLGIPQVVCAICLNIRFFGAGSAGAVKKKKEAEAAGASAGPAAEKEDTSGAAVLPAEAPVKLA